MKKTDALNCLVSEFTKGGRKMEYSFGSDEYIEYIVGTYSSAIFRLAYTYVGNVADAEDITSDVLESLMTKRRESFTDTAHEQAWLMRVTINKSKNFLRSGWVRRTVALDEALHTQFSDGDSGVLDEVLRLPEKYRTTIHLYYYGGYSLKEIAAIMKTTPATAGTRLARGRAILKTKLKEGFDDEE